ncbi:MAG: hypothetical protein EZS28_036637, partial [Streblomastix strix]
MNELFIRSGALSAVVPKAPAHSLWVSVIGGEVLSTEPEEEPLLRQSFHMAFGKDISSELSNKRLFFLHFCPGHTRIDDIKEFNSQSLQKGCWKTLLAEQFLSEIAYRLHCTPKKIDKSSVSLNDRDNIEGSDVGCADVEFYDDADD